MGPPSTIRDIDRDAPVQRRIWLASRIAWGAMAAILALAAAGLFGEGWLASREAEAADGSLRVAFDRFQRTDAVTELVLTARRPGDAALCFDRAFLHGWRIQGMEPAPVREEALGEEICRVVQAGAAVPFLIRVQAMPRRTTLSAQGRIRLAGAAPVSLRVLVWP